MQNCCVAPPQGDFASSRIVENGGIFFLTGGGAGRDDWQVKITDFVGVLGDKEGGVLAEYQEKVPGTFNSLGAP